jgi:hypothetical protein
MIHDQEALLGDSAETKAVAGQARKVDLASFEILRGFGDQTSRWVETSERKL